MTDVSSPMASSSGAPATTSNKIPVGPSAAGKRELDDARDDDDEARKNPMFSAYASEKELPIKREKLARANTPKI